MKGWKTKMVVLAEQEKSKKTNYPDYFSGKAEVKEVIKQGYKWRVYFNGIWWNAVSVEDFSLFPGDEVMVFGQLEGNLLVRPI